jgi:hypothetical protein
MKTESLIERLAEITKKGAPLVEDEEVERPRLKCRDQRSARAKARNAAHRRALTRGIPKQSKFAPKRRWTTPGFRTGWRPPPGASVLDGIVRAMEPGSWYAVTDLMNLARLTRNESLGVRLFSHGYLTRRRNPEWQRWEAPPNERHPHWLYTLTPAGLERQRLLLALGEETSDRRSLRQKASAGSN